MEKKPLYDIDKELLLKILDNTFMNLFVADSSGTIVYANQGSFEVLGISPEELIGMTSQELVDKKIIDVSITLEALEKRDVAVGEQRTQLGHKLWVVSRPLFDEDNKVSYVITNSSQDSSMHQFIAMLEKERMHMEQYRSALSYFMEHNGMRNKIVVESEVMRLLFKRMTPAIQSGSTMLLYGESGVGKDVVANFIHTNSPRAHEPFIPVNCAAIPQELAESEFFGYEAGAFTGASRLGRAGFFEMANKGTLFLDEIGDLPLSMQSKLLRVLEDRSVSRIGGKKAIQVDIRIIAATNCNLPKMVEDKTFREDLYYRLNVAPFIIPPLRERRDDILPLAETFLENYNQKYNKRRYYSFEVRQAFLGYPWKGNVRELKNIVERLSIMADAEVITIDDLYSIGFEFSRPQVPLQIASSEQTRFLEAQGDVGAASQADPNATIIERYQRAEKERVLQALISAKGNKSKAAEALGISRGKLYKLLDS